MKIKILVGYHKPACLIKSEVFIPIHLGRALFLNQYSVSAESASKEQRWMIDNLIGDDTGDNISSQNRQYCELTGIYWAWKNYDKLGSPDFIGFMHYRRWLALCGWSLPKKAYSVIAATSKQFLKKNDVKSVEYKLSLGGLVFARMPISFFKSKEREACREKGLLILKQKYPDIYQIYLEQKKLNLMYASNMFILKKEDFFSYCDMIFDVLKDYDTQQFTREKGYLAEFITSAYLGFIAHKYNSSITELPVCTPCEHPYLRQINLFLLKVACLVSFGDLKKQLKKKRETLKWVL